MSEKQCSYLAGFIGVADKLTMTVEQAASAWEEATKAFSDFNKVLETYERYERRERVRKYQALWLI